MHECFDAMQASQGLDAPAHADAEVIRLAAEVERGEAAWSATFDPPAGTPEDEAARELDRDRLAALRNKATEHLAALTPRTLPGLVALARAALALADRDADGDIVARDDADLLRITLMEHVAALGVPQATRLAQ